MVKKRKSITLFVKDGYIELPEPKPLRFGEIDDFIKKCRRKKLK